MSPTVDQPVPGSTGPQGPQGLQSAQGVRGSPGTQAVGSIAGLTGDGAGNVNVSGSFTSNGLKSKLTPVCDVTTYGAVGDCSSNGSTEHCTDNTAAIQAAIDACYLEGGGVVFLQLNPANPNGGTTYYVASSLNPKGVSIRGAGGRSAFYPKDAVRGAPGKDVFNVIDPTVGGYVNPYMSFVWEDFGIIVDDSMDASASFTHRKPGKTCNDVTAKKGSAVITSSTCEFVPGDVGQNVKLIDGTNTLSTTIASVSTMGASGFGVSSATLAANWTYTTRTNTTLYVSVMNMPVTQRVGNCALAYDDTTGAGHGGPNGGVFRNLQIVTTSGNAQNNVCAFFFQGVAGQPYASQWDNIFWRTAWGFVAVEADNPTHGTNGALGDLNQFQDLFIESNYPLVTYDGDWIRWDGGQIADAWFGPQILDFGVPTNESSANYWTIKNEEFEQQGAPSSGGGWRIEGANHRIEGSTLGNSGYTAPAQWDAYISRCTNCIVTGNLNVTGGLNHIELADGADHAIVNDTGLGNLCAKGREFSPLNSQEPGLWTACSAIDSRQNLAFAHTADFVANGNELTPFNNQADLWIWPRDLETSVGQSYNVVPDATSESGAYLVIPGMTGFIGLNGTGTISIGPSNSGPNLPATKVHVCGRAKIDSGITTTSFQLWVDGNSVGSTGANLTTTYSTSCFDSDLSSFSGKAAMFVVGPNSVAVDLAWLSVHAWPDAVNVKGPVTATTFQVGTTQLAVPSSRQTVGAILCVKAAGPPLVYGTCTSVTIRGTALRCTVCN